MIICGQDTAAVVFDNTVVDHCPGMLGSVLWMKELKGVRAEIVEEIRLSLIEEVRRCRSRISVCGTLA
jgi:hypothetical protein